MLFLPKNLAGLANIAAKENPRYAMAAVRVMDKGDGKYLAESTDGRRLARVEGCSSGEEVAELASAPNGHTETLIERNNFAAAMKITADEKKKVPNAGLLAMSIGEMVTTVCTSGKTRSVMTLPKPDGRFLSIDPVIQDATKEEPTFTIKVSAKLLAELLMVAAEFHEETEVTLEFRKPNTPIVIRAKNANQQFTGLLVPRS